MTPGLPESVSRVSAPAEKNTPDGTEDPTGQAVEDAIAQCAQAAFERAREEALALGAKLVCVERDRLVEMDASGTLRVLKTIDPPLPVVRGTRIRLACRKA